MALQRRDIVTILEEAAGIVEESGIPESFRTKAFEVVLRFRLSRDEPPAIKGPQVESQQEDDPFEMIAEKAGQESERMKEIYRFDGKELSLVVGHNRIDSTNAGGSRELTLLIAAGRQAAGMEDWTSLSVARETCREYGRFDSNNFASAITASDDTFAFSGTGANRQVRLTMPGWDVWRTLISRLLSKES